MDKDLKPRLRRALYRLFEQHGADYQTLSLIGSLWDTLSEEEVVSLMEDQLATGSYLHVPH